MTCTYELKETLLTLDNLSLSLGGKPVLAGVCARVRNVTRPGVQQGQVIGVLGPSGVGKTQLFRVLSGLTPPDSGRVLLGPRQEPVACGLVGVVAQAYPLFEHYSVRQNLIVAARQHGLDESEARAQSAKLLARFALEECAAAYPATLSGGQRQRVAIAQQLLRPKPLLLLDEPFSGLDPAMARKVCELLTEVSRQDEQLTTVVVTHDIGAALSIADTLWLLGRPRAADGTRGGARIVHCFDLMERGLAWHPDVAHAPEFESTKREVERRFAAL